MFKDLFLKYYERPYSNFHGVIGGILQIIGGIVRIISLGFYNPILEIKYVEKIIKRKIKMLKNTKVS